MAIPHCPWQWKNTEKALKAAVTIAAAYGLYCVSMDTGYLQLAAANAIAIIIIVAPRTSETRFSSIVNINIIARYLITIQ
jgi:hypothetical protein